MPRKTIAGLEAEISDAVDQLIDKDLLIAKLREALETERASHEETVAAIKADPNVYLSYVPSGDAEVDAMTVAYRALDSLPAEDRPRCVQWVYDRIMQTGD